MPDKPIDPVTLDEAALILGGSSSIIRRYKADGRLAATERYGRRQLARAGVEAVALRTLRWHRHLRDRAPYWITGKHAQP